MIDRAISIAPTSSITSPTAATDPAVLSMSSVPPANSIRPGGNPVASSEAATTRHLCMRPAWMVLARSMPARRLIY
jgi:hypothetical protein